MPNAITSQSATRLAALIRAREISPVEVMEAHLARIDSLNPKLNAIVTLASNAIDLARDAEAAVMRGDDLGPLHGLPITIKDTIYAAGLRTTSGSLPRQAHVPVADAPAVAKLKSAGAIVIGKSNVPEMAIPYECDNPIFGRTNNPYDLNVTSGGSSGGEAAAIAACLSPAGLGSDLSGSIRVPAHFCGIAGLKPTPGRVPSGGHFPSIRDPLSEGAVIGPMARTVGDLALLFDVLTNAGDAAQSAIAAGKAREQCVALSLDERSSPIDDETRQAIEASRLALKDAGLIPGEEQPPGLERAAELWSELFSSPSALEIREVYESQEESAGPNVRRVLASIEPGPHQSSSVSWEERNLLRDEVILWMKRVPLIIAPVGCVSAFEHGVRRVEINGQQISVWRAFGSSRIANVLGLPAVVVRAGTTRNGLPIGVQIMGRPNEEAFVMAAAAIIEESIGGWIPALELPD